MVGVQCAGSGLLNLITTMTLQVLKKSPVRKRRRRRRKRRRVLT
jgi:hypothetical protein